jgi:photosystem II stability/assembly factor-like uncharacterized protein
MVAFDPSDPARLFAGSNVGGPYRSDDAGQSWVAITDGIMGLGAKYRNPSGGIVFDRNNPQVIYKGGYFLFKSVDGGDSWDVIREGVSYRVALDSGNPGRVYASGKPGDIWAPSLYRSDDAGGSWADHSLGLPSAITVYAIEVDTLTADVYLCSSAGVFRSAAGTLPWSDFSDGLPVSRMATVYAAHNTGGYQAVYPMALHRSAANGLVLYVLVDSLHVRAGGDAAWSKPANVNFGVVTNTPFQTVVVHPQDPSRVYVAGWSGMRRSTNGGGTWSWVGCADDGWLGQGQCGLGPWGCYVMSLAISESDPDRLLAGTQVALLRSGDGGSTWTQAYTREDPPASDFWISRGTDPVYAYDAAFDSSDPDLLYVGYADTGLMRSEDGGGSFHHACDGMRLKSQGEDAPAVSTDPSDGAIVYATVYHEFNLVPGLSGKCSVIARSDDHGGTWTLVGTPEPSHGSFPQGRILSFALGSEGAPGARRIYAALNAASAAETTLTVMASADGGATWVERGGGLPDPDPYGGIVHLEATRIIVAPDDHDHAYLTIASSYVEMDDQHADVPGGLWETTDGGQNWQRVTPIEQIRSLNDVAMDPVDPDVIYLAANDHVDWYAQALGDTTWFYPGGVYKTVDGGGTWECVVEDHLVTCVAISPDNRRVVYAGSADWAAWWQDLVDGVYPGGITLNPGILRSADGGETWSLENEGLGHLHPLRIACDPRRTGTLFMGTRGGGHYVGLDADVLLAAPDAGSLPPGGVTALHLAIPTPLSDAARIRFSFEARAAAPVALAIYDVAGRCLRTIASGRFQPGAHAAAWDGRDRNGRLLPGGAYFARLEVGGAVATSRIVVVR